MDRKIPSKSRVISAIKKVMSSRIKVESQDELAKLVERELKKENKNYVLTPTRVKRIALEIPEIEVRAKTKKSSSLRKISKCPICNSAIRPIKVKNLLGQNIIVGYKCTRCGYQSDLEAFLPMKYEFVYKPKVMR